jgi:hypothetical protein
MPSDTQIRMSAFADRLFVGFVAVALDDLMLVMGRLVGARFVRHRDSSSAACAPTVPTVKFCANDDN